MLKLINDKNIDELTKQHNKICTTETIPQKMVTFTFIRLPKKDTQKNKMYNK